MVNLITRLISIVTSSAFRSEEWDVDIHLIADPFTLSVPSDVLGSIQDAIVRVFAGDGEISRERRSRSNCTNIIIERDIECEGLGSSGQPLHIIEGHSIDSLP